MPGVKDVVADITVLPTSFYDNRIRLQTARVLYRDPVLSKYATDPARPIRIIVDNGHVTLYGAVDSKMDKEVAGIRAGSVFGAFSVDNQLTID
jgi:osmotically-inducible protein OsmY